MVENKVVAVLPNKSTDPNYKTKKGVLLRTRFEVVQHVTHPVRNREHRSSLLIEF